jgi:hypothetical protein
MGEKLSLIIGKDKQYYNRLKEIEVTDDEN